VSHAEALPGMEAGRRKECTEWGLRTTRDTFLHRKGDVVTVQDEAHARRCVGHAEWGWAATEVVSRTVVTYTTRWERS
jgi:hypothetical protein